eukprot:g2983.t1
MLLVFSRRLSQIESTVSSAEELVEILTESPSNVRVIIDSTRIRLQEPLTISENNVTIEGVFPSRPVITCPPNQPAFIIEGSDIRLESLEFANCNGNSSIFVRGVDRGSRAVELELHDVIFRGNEASSGSAISIVSCISENCTLSAVTITRCQFEHNKAIIGGAIYALNAAVQITDSIFNNNIARGTAGGIYIGNGLQGSTLDVSSSDFTDNTAEGLQETDNDVGRQIHGRAGAIYAKNTASLTLSNCNFIRNRGCLGSGAIEIRNSSPDNEENVSYTMMIDNCTFVQNQAYCNLSQENIIVEDFSSPRYAGGAMTYTAQGIMNLTWTVSHSNFTENRAHHGGALTIVGGGGCLLIVSTVVNLSRSNFTNSQGVFGGGLVVMDLGVLTTDPDLDQGIGSVFENNTAVYGGALFLVYTGRVKLNGLMVRNNTAFRYGGGLRYYDSPDAIELNGVHFEGNSARVGGAAAMLGFGNLTITKHKNQNSVFKDNKSVVGGALFLEIGHFIAFYLHITNSDFIGNEALRRDDQFIRSLENNDAHYSPIDDLTEEILDVILSRSEEEDILGRMTDIDDGRGGGVCLALVSMRVYTNAEILFENIIMQSNRAIVGAGLAVFVNRLEWNNGSLTSCFPTSFGMETCRLLQFQNVNMTQNVAHFAGGLFITDPYAITNACDRFHPLPNRTLPEIMQIQRQMERDEIPYNHSKLHCTHLHDNIVRSNRSSNSSADVGTTVQSLQLVNVNGERLARTASRERLSVSCPENYNDVESDCDPLIIAVKDAFDQTIEQAIPDAELEVTLQSESDSITGVQRYQAEGGIINITNTLAWGINMTAQLTIVSDQQSDLNVSTYFSTRECYPGELRDDYECRPCVPDEYNLDTEDPRGCRHCEEHAICRGKAALVPEDKYWHSTPFSPAFAKCIIEEACVFENRVDQLTDYYNNALRLIRELNELEDYLRGMGDLSEFLEYKQCKDGYGGIRCGSCAEGYGRSYDRKCKNCPDNNSSAEIVASFSVLWIFFFISANCIITLSSTKARIRLAYQQSKSHVNSPARDLRKTPGFKKPEVQPTLLRSPTIYERTEQTETVAMESLTQQLTATVQLIEMIKILINYLQITSIALQLHIDWKPTLKWILAIEGIIAGVSGESLIVPFECSFNQNGRVNPSISALWVGASAPLMILIMIILIFILSWYYYEKHEKQKCMAPRIDKLSLTSCLIVFTIVSIYFSYLCSFKELLRTINCVSAEHTEHITDDYYLKYAVYRNKVVWAEDTDLMCFEGGHLATGIAGTIGVAIYVGLLVLLIVWVSFNQHRFSDPEFIARYWFIYQAYKTERYTFVWEAVVLLRKALIATVIVFSVHMGPNLQASTCVGILFVAQLLHTIVRPYKEYSEYNNVPEYAGTVLKWIYPKWVENWLVLNNAIGLNAMESISLMSSVVVFFTGIILHDSYSSDRGKIIMNVFGCGVNLGFVMFMLYRMYLTMHYILDHKLETTCPSFLVNFPENGSFASLFTKVKEIIRQKLVRETNEVEIAYVNTRIVLPVINETHDNALGASSSN